MKTKGVNKTSDLEQLRRGSKFGSQTYYECSMKEMMISCYAYGGIGRDDYNFTRYILPYKQHIPKVFDMVYDEQAAYLEQCSVLHGVHTDHEGCTYNSIVEPNA